jgi:hypothetical protein
LQTSIAYFTIDTTASHTRRVARAPAAADDTLSAAHAPKRRLSRLPPAPPPKKPRADNLPVRSGYGRTTQPDSGLGKKQTGPGFALDLAHAPEADHDADFVKY